jgi:glycosyltransferase involved in cell wall biosynthesis
MSVIDHPSVSAAARKVARRTGISSRRHRKQVPRLRVAQGGAAPEPTLWMVCPDFDEPSGGLRKQYRAVDILNRAGLNAAVVHTRSGFECTWFEHGTRIVSAGEIAVGKGDVIAVPEIYGPSIADLPAGVRQVIFNQGAYLALDTLVTGGPPAAAPYLDNRDLAAVVVVSDDSAAVIRYAFPGVPVHRIHHGVDPTIHYPPAKSPRRRIAYMTRRRAHEAAQVLSLLGLRGVLDDWEVVAIEGKTELEVADILRSSQIFLSFSQLEGFGLPPLEALACGCLVVGFNGFGGRELFQPPFALPVEDGDVVAFAQAVEEVIRRIGEDPLGAEKAAESGACFALSRYSLEAERQDLLDVFAPLLAA